MHANCDCTPSCGRKDLHRQPAVIIAFLGSMMAFEKSGLENHEWSKFSVKKFRLMALLRASA
jgi:hypothetical protein